MQTDRKEQLSPATIVLHWIVAVLIIGLIAVGIYMEENEVISLYGWHKSFGVIALLFILARVIWRIREGWLAPASDYKAWEKKLARLTQWILLIGMVLFPISGMLMSGFGGYGIKVFGLELMAMNFNPSDPTEILPVNESLAGIGHVLHGTLGNVFIVVISLHVLGALKHHTIDKDNTLRRMLGRG